MRLRISQDIISEILSPVVCPLQYTPRQSSGIPLGEATYSSYIPKITLLCSHKNVINDGYVPKSAQQNSINSLSRRVSPAWSFPGVVERGWVRSPVEGGGQFPGMRRKWLQQQWSFGSCGCSGRRFWPIGHMLAQRRSGAGRGWVMREGYVQELYRFIFLNSCNTQVL